MVLHGMGRGKNNTQGSAPFSGYAQGSSMTPISILRNQMGGSRACLKGHAAPEDGSDLRQRSASSLRAHPFHPGSPTAGRSSLRMSRRCCVASSMSMLAQDAMGPTTKVRLARGYFLYLRALSKFAQPRPRQTAEDQALHNIYPQFADRHRVASRSPANPTNRLHFRSY